ncbi:Acyl_transf_3 domain-containing protein [Burkholderia diffusa]|uniref:acyltransferase family protein n=1 Tax=Burkholderia diffusa TaxID=488732 RepID=UPI001CADA6CA|nr:acyltransferase [Burkholderia diffusa]CAG9262103.1 Acyl_transf_3 domain-containing protein [Burkholderia diffusa]
MGIYRLLLAVAVVLSHIGIGVYGRNIGVVAVLSFFLISGYVMTALIERHYATARQIPRFYVDRALRLFPQFLFYSLLTLALIAVAHPSSGFLSGLTPALATLNLTMLPLNFYRYFPDALVIPQAWSLGLEAQFYIVVPLLIIFRLRVVATVLSAAFFLLPYFGYVDADTWSYRMLPGTLFVFMLGSLLRAKNQQKLVSVLYGFVCLLFLGVLAFRTTPSPIFEVLFGTIVGVPAVILLTRVPFGKWEALAGNLSYGVFLNHFFLIWLFQCIGIDSQSSVYLPVLLTSSLVLAALSYYLVEHKVIEMRHRLREKPRAAVQGTSGIAIDPISR